MKTCLYIDTNIYTACAAAELGELDLNVLKRVKEKLNLGWHLILPEVIQVEIKKRLKDSFKSFRDDAQLSNAVNKENNQPKRKYEKFREEKITQIKEAAIKEANTKILKEFDKAEEDAGQLLDDLFSHKNCIIVPLSQKILLDGMCRAALGKRPAAVDTKKEQPHYIRDIDCIAFESLLHGMGQSKAKFDEVLICSDDSDYFSKGKLAPEIIDALKPFSKIQKGYTDILVLLEEASPKAEKFTEKQREGFVRASDAFLPVSSVYLTASSLDTLSPMSVALGTYPSASSLTLTDRNSSVDFKLRPSVLTGIAADYPCFLCGGGSSVPTAIAYSAGTRVCSNCGRVF